MEKEHMIENFTPVLDTITERFDLLTSVVYGKVWRYSQMDDNTCYASQARIAREIGVSAKTVNRKLRKLIEAGYVVDLTPERRYQTHEFTVSNKAGIVINATAFDETESPASETLSPPTKTESPTKVDRESVKESNKKQIKKETGPSPEYIPFGDEFKTKKPPKPSDHVAVKAFRSAASRRPNKATYIPIAEAVGEKHEDVERWKGVVTAWIMRGWNPLNIKGMLEVFEKGWTKKEKSTAQELHDAGYK